MNQSQKSISLTFPDVTAARYLGFQFGCRVLMVSYMSSPDDGGDYVVVTLDGYGPDINRLQAAYERMKEGS